eukprot:6192978-Pleurochrysis_carterae.AAC.2
MSRRDGQAPPPRRNIPAPYQLTAHGLLVVQRCRISMLVPEVFHMPSSGVILLVGCILIGMARWIGSRYAEHCAHVVIAREKRRGEQENMVPGPILSAQLQFSSDA